MPRVLVWTEADISGLEGAWGLACILTEVEEDGTVTRELGLDADGKVVHRHPGGPTRAQYGVFDLATTEPADGTDMALDEFERLWLA